MTNKLSKTAKRKKWAGYMRQYLASHPEQVRKKAERHQARKAKKKAAKLIHSAASEASSPSARKVSTLNDI
jgi:hypothetical protein